MRHCESYIVRIYSREQSDPANIAGTVEIVQTGAVEKFAGRDGLYGVICRAPKDKRRRGKGLKD